ncbi:MAG: hypothetical protein JWN76_2977 [Chitinophagaceae bacterium]|nr:hypothetical protein [Chitinophagaceae bacterium]
MKKQQTLSNHSRLLPGYHGFTLLSVLAIFILAVLNAIHQYGNKDWIYNALAPLLVSIVIMLLYYYTRSFALTAQDRAIRSEEALRYFVLTGTPLPQKLSVSQVIALRFASDGEFPALAKKATEENLSAGEIKKSITEWKPDHYRV